MGSERLLNTKRNIVTGFSVRIIDLLFPFVINTVVIKTLGVEYIGLNSLFASVLQVLSLAELGVGSAMVFSMYEPIANGNSEKVCSLLKMYRSIYLVIGLVILTAGLICLPFLPGLISGEVPDGINVYILFIISLSNTSVSYFLFSYRTALLQASQRLDIKDIITIVTNFLLNISKIVILLVYKNYYAICIAVPVFTVINNIIVYLVTKRKYPEYRCSGSVPKEERKQILDRVKGLFINRLCNVICNSFDSIVISGFLGLEILGKYDNYFHVMNAILTLAGILIASAIPGIGNSIVKETKEKNHRDFMTLQFGYSWLIGWAAVCLLCLYQPFIELWVGQKMLMEMPISVLFCIYMYMVKASEVFMAYRQATGIWAKDKVRPVLEAAVNLALNIFLVKTIGVAGVMLSTIFTLGLIHVIWGSYYLYKEYFTEFSHVKYLMRQLLYLVVTAGIAALTWFICDSFTPQSGVQAIVIRGVICIILPNILFAMAYFKLPEFRDSIGLAKGLLIRRR